MKCIETGIQDLVVIEPQIFGDERGFFLEMHHGEKFKEMGIEPNIVQINNSFSSKGVLRGLHYQAPPSAQSKLVRCVSGSLFDVAVDIRKGSPTYGKWFGVELSAKNKKMLFVPEGFAHGFYATTDCEMLYLCGGSNYDNTREGGLRWNSEDIGIEWPIDGEVNTNERDGAYPTLAEFDSPFEFQSKTEKIAV